MSEKWIAIGQGGIQLSTQLQNSYNTFNIPFHYQITAIDSEVKVLDRFNNKINKILLKKGGNGNCWAMGYSSCPNLTERFRKSMERDMNLDPVVISYATAGGTGSGTSSKLFESFAEYDFLNSIPLVSICLLPFESGDTPLQYYNSVLSLAHSLTYSDIVYIANNDDLLNISSNSSVKGTMTEVGTLNELFANSFMDFHRDRICDNMFETLINVCPVPQLKFCGLASSLSTSVAKKQRVRDCSQMYSDLFLSMPHQGFFDRQYQSLGACVNIYGNESPVRNLYKYFPTANWRGDSIKFCEQKDSFGIPSLSMAYNNSWIVPKLEWMIERATEKFNVRAYWHYYERYGTSDIQSVFEESLETLKSTIDAYLV